MPPCSPGARSRPRRGARRRAVSSSGSPTPTSTAAFASQRPAVGHRQRLAELALEAGLVEERGEPAVERGVDRVGAGAERAALAHDRDREQLGGDAVGGRGDDGERERHECSGGVGGWSVAGIRVVGADGPEGALLPAGERVDEVGEPVEVRHDLAVGRASPRAAAATARRSARRTTVRATSSAAATRFSPGSTNSVRRLVARGDVVDDRLERRRPSSSVVSETPGVELARGSPARWRARRRPRTARAGAARAARRAPSRARSRRGRARAPRPLRRPRRTRRVRTCPCRPVRRRAGRCAVVARARVDLRSHRASESTTGRSLQPCGQWRVRSRRCVRYPCAMSAVPDPSRATPPADPEPRRSSTLKAVDPHRAPEAVDQERPRVRGAGRGRACSTERDALARRRSSRSSRFCLAASGTYFLNDAADAEADRLHPTKRLPPDRGRRPRACARARVIAVVLILLSLVDHRADQRRQAHRRRRRLRRSSRSRTRSGSSTSR